MLTITESEFSQDMDGALQRFIDDGAIAKLSRAQGESVMLIPTSVWEAILTHLDDLEGFYLAEERMKDFRSEDAIPLADLKVELGTDA